MSVFLRVCSRGLVPRSLQIIERNSTASLDDGLTFYTQMRTPVRDQLIVERTTAVAIDTRTLIWLFPAAYMLHDFEEIIFFERWLKKNGGEIKRRVPAFFAKQVDALMKTSTAEFSVAVCLIFSLTVFSSFLATEYQKFTFFLLASAIFFVNAFVHFGQVVLLRRYVPGAITSALIIIPYGLVLYSRLTGTGVVSGRELMAYFALGAAAIMPLILLMHKVGVYLYGLFTKNLTLGLK